LGDKGRVEDGRTSVSVLAQYRSAREGVFNRFAFFYHQRVIKHRLGKREVCRQKKEGKDGFAHSLYVFTPAYWGALTFSSEQLSKAENLFLSGIDTVFSVRESKKTVFLSKMGFFHIKN
jgi:hypothetical protein